MNVFKDVCVLVKNALTGWTMEKAVAFGTTPKRAAMAAWRMMASFDVPDLCDQYAECLSSILQANKIEHHIVTMVPTTDQLARYTSDGTKVLDGHAIVVGEDDRGLWSAGSEWGFSRAKSWAALKRKQSATCRQPMEIGQKRRVVAKLQNDWDEIGI